MRAPSPNPVCPRWAWWLALVICLLLDAAPAPGGIELLLRARGQSGVELSPDGSQLAYIDKVTGVPQVWRVDAAGGWPVQLTFVKGGVEWVDWSPVDPELLVVGADAAGNEETQLYAMRPDGSGWRRLTGAEDARHGFGDYAPSGAALTYHANDRRPDLYAVYELELASGTRRLLYEPEIRTAAGGYSPDGRALLVSHSLASDQSLLGWVEVATGAYHRLTAEQPAARYRRAQWSADGRSIWTLTDAATDRLAVATIDRASGALTVVREGPGPAEALRVAAERFAVVWNEAGESVLELVDLDDGELWRPPLPRGMVRSFDATTDLGRVAVAVSQPTHPAEIFMVDCLTRQVWQVTRAQVPGDVASGGVAPERVEFDSFDGERITGIFYAARGATQPAPLVVYAHGGPSSQSRPRFSPLFQFLARRGYAVFTPNVRGSSGYGRRFLTLDNTSRREDSVRDLKAGLDHILATRAVDPERVAIYGTSYGGYMVLAAMTLYPEAFAAGVERVGIVNFVTFLEGTAPSRRRHREKEYGSLQSDRALLESISPIHRLDALAAPLMVIHGVNDRRVPIGEAEQLVDALKRRGHPVEFLRLESEGHGISDVDTRVGMYESLVQFLDRVLEVRDAPEDG